MKANSKSLAKGLGFAVVVRESKAKEAGMTNYTQCHKCSGMYSNKTLYRHLRICKFDSLDRESPKQLNLRTSRMLMQSMLSADTKYCELRSRIVSRMKSDELTNLISNDEGLLLYGYHLFEKGGETAFNEISSKLRCMARLILKYREIEGSNEITSLSLIDPSCWDKVINSVKSLVNHKVQKVGTPSLLLNIGRSLACLAGAKRALGIKMKDDSIVHDARNFLELHNEEWSIYAKHALDSMKKDNVPEELPLPSDIEKLKDYLTAEIKDCLQNKSLDRKTWIHLNQVTLARIIAFNARRGSEPSKLHITHWENADIWKRQEDIDNLKDPIEKILAKKMKMIY